MPARLDEPGACGWCQREREREREQGGGGSRLRAGGEIAEGDPGPEDLVHGRAPWCEVEDGPEHRAWTAAPVISSHPRVGSDSHLQHARTNTPAATRPPSHTPKPDLPWASQRGRPETPPRRPKEQRSSASPRSDSRESGRRVSAEGHPSLVLL